MLNLTEIQNRISSPESTETSSMSPQDIRDLLNKKTELRDIITMMYQHSVGMDKIEEVEAKYQSICSKLGIEDNSEVYFYNRLMKFIEFKDGVYKTEIREFLILNKIAGRNKFSNTWKWMEADFNKYIKSFGKTLKMSSGGGNIKNYKIVGLNI